MPENGTVAVIGLSLFSLFATLPLTPLKSFFEKMN
jgi:hypothetical protein